MNEEKDPKWFVWERNFHGICTPAIYRGMPQTGNGAEKDSARFALRMKLAPEEQNLSLDELTEKYPCPDGEVVTHKPRQAANLSRSELP